MESRSGSQIVIPAPARLSLSFSHSVPARRRSVPASPTASAAAARLRCLAPAIILRPGTGWPASNRIIPC